MKKKLIIISAVLVVVLLSVLSIKYMNSDKNDLLSGLNYDKSAKEPMKESTLTFYFEANEPKDTREILDVVEKKAKNMLNIKLDFKYFPEAPEVYLNRIKTAISSGQPCDAFLYIVNGSTKNLKSLADEGLIKDLTTLFPEKAPDYFNQFSKQELTAMSVNNKIYAIPGNFPSAQIRSAMVRDDLMKKYDIPDIKSYKDYEFYLKTIKEKEPDMIPMIINEAAIGLFAEAGGYVILDYKQGLVYKWDDPDMKIVAWEQTSEFREGINTILKWYNSNFILKDIGIAQIDDTVISSGKWASFISVYGSELLYNSKLLNQKSTWKYKAYPLYPDKFTARSFPLNIVTVINAKSQNIDRVLMFINWLQSNQENYDSLMYGIKGKHYTLEDNKIKLPTGIKPEASNLSWPWRYLFRNIKYERADASVDEAALKEYNQIISTRTKYPPHTGFVPDYTSLTDITASRNMSYNQIEQDIFQGYLEEADIDTYIKSQKDLGVDNLVNKIQQQLDEWKTENSKSK